MRIAGVPLWTLVLVACIVAPFLVRVWIEAEQRRAKVRTARVLQGLTTREPPGADPASDPSTNGSHGA